MRDHSDQHLEAQSSVSEEDLLATQRAALRDVLDLCARSVEPAESRIEGRIRRSEKESQENLAVVVRAVEVGLEQDRAEAQREYHDCIAQVDRLRASDLRELEDRTETARERILSEAGEVTSNAKRDLDRATWMAETVAAAAVKRLQKAFGEIRDELAAERERLAAEREYVADRLRAYRKAFVVDLDPVEAEPDVDDDPIEAFNRQVASIDEYLGTFDRLLIAPLFIGSRPYWIVGSLCVLAAAGVWVLDVLQVPHAPPLAWGAPAAAAGALLLSVLVGRLLRRWGQRRVRALCGPLERAFAIAERALALRLEREEQRYAEEKAKEIEKGNHEVGAARQVFDRTKGEADAKRAAAVRRIEDTRAKLTGEIERRHEAGIQGVDALKARRDAEVQARYERDLAAAREQHRERLEVCRGTYEAARFTLERRWDEGLSRIRRLLDDTERVNRAVFGWHDRRWADWRPPTEPMRVIPFGHWSVDLAQLAGSVRRRAPFSIDGAATVSVPALLALPKRGSLLLETGRTGRDEAIAALQAVMLRLLTSFPPGRVQFTIIDPVGLGESFAGFMHLADHEGTLVGSRIWTDTVHIEQRLVDLTSHMENVIQKYLRNEFETIDAYNRQAAELAEPYRFLVVADFPVNFNENAAARLSAIVGSGPRCGVYTLLAFDSRKELPPGVEIEDIRAACTHLVHDGERFVWQDDVLRRFPLTLDTPPADEAVLTRVMHAVGRGAADSVRVEVPFETIAPAADACWNKTSDTDLQVPIGRTGAVRSQHLRLGHGVAQHGLIAGKTGSGKSTLLHVIITNLALWYGPDEVEFYLVDFKKGVEFKTYVTHRLPHARAIAIESDREFGLSVLERIDAEMARRGDLFRRHQVQDLAAYRQAAGATLPRTLLIVDEFQLFFSEDDKLSQDAAVLLDRLVRQGRAFGIHVLLGSQTLGGMAGLARSTMGQMAVRVALQCSEADSQLILDDANLGARLLSRPGEAIYNDAGGLIEGNNPFQTAWLSDAQRDTYLDRIAGLAEERGAKRERPIVFEGNAPADIRQNATLTRLLETPNRETRTAIPQVWLGEPVAIKDPTAVAMRRQAGANLLVVGQRDEAASALMAAALLSLGAQHAPDEARFVILDGTPADSPLAGHLERVASVLPHAVDVVGWRDVDNAIVGLGQETRTRLDVDRTDAPAVFLLVHGLQRYRMLRRPEDEFSFSVGDDDAPPDPHRQFMDVLREGPPVGIHTLAWADTLATVDRTVDRQTMREFDNRVLFQMSAADSSNLIDSTAATKLGVHRAILYSEEQGFLEKFRPYAFPDSTWLEEVGRQAASRQST